MDLNRLKIGKPAYPALAIFALGCASVFLMVGTIGGFSIATLAGVAILALLIFVMVCGAIYFVITLMTRGTPHFKENKLPMRGGEWWRR